MSADAEWLQRLRLTPIEEQEECAVEEQARRYRALEPLMVNWAREFVEADRPRPEAEAALHALLLAVEEIVLGWRWSSGAPALPPPPE